MLGTRIAFRLSRSSVKSQKLNLNHMLILIHFPSFLTQPQPITITHCCLARNLQGYCNMECCRARNERRFLTMPRDSLSSSLGPFVSSFSYRSLHARTNLCKGSSFTTPHLTPVSSSDVALLLFPRTRRRRQAPNCSIMRWTHASEN